MNSSGADVLIIIDINEQVDRICNSPGHTKSMHKYNIIIHSYLLVKGQEARLSHYICDNWRIEFNYICLQYLLKIMDIYAWY